MDLDRIAPRVDMTLFTAIVFQVSCGAHENPAQVHELAERKISKEGTDQKKMHVKYYSHFFWNNRAEVQDSKGKSLNLKEVYPVKVPHENSRHGDPEEEQEEEVVREKRDEPYLRINNSPQEKISEGSQDENVSHEKRGG